MKQLTCEMCGSKELIKKDGFFVCQTCGCKYSVEEAKKMMIEGAGEVQGAVKVEKNDQIKNLLKRAEIAMQDKKFGEAESSVDKILDIDAECAEAYEVLLLCAMKSLYKDLLLSPKNIAANENYAKIKKFGSKELVNKYEEIQNSYFEKEYQKALTLYNSGNCTVAVLIDIEEIMRPLVLAEYKDSKEVWANIYGEIEKVKKKIENLPEEEYSFTYGYGEIVKLTKEGYVIIANSQDSKMFYFWDIQNIEIEKDEICKTIKIFGKEGIKRKENFVLFMCENKDWATVRKALIEIINRMQIVGNTSFYTNISGFNGNWEFFDEDNCTYNIELGEDEINIVETKGNGKVINKIVKYSNIKAISYGSFIFGQYQITITLRDKLTRELIVTKGNGGADLKALFLELKERAPQTTAKTGGCYVATCVYGSYDCPEVWTLRRYRDDTLGSTWYGRAFIRTYYAISPTLVKWFGKTKWFKKMWKGKLDRMVKNLQEKGVENTPYEDKEW